MRNVIRKKNALVFVLFFWFCGCENSSKQGNIEEQKMVQLLVHMHILEAKMSNSYLPGDSAIRYFTWMQDSIFRHFDTDSAAFFQSLAYYNKHPEILNKIYTQVVDSLALREQIRNIRYK